MVKLITILLLCNTICFAEDVTVFEMSCQSYTSEGTKDYTQTFIYNGELITAKFHPDFLEGLKTGFCLFGPIDRKEREEQLQQQLKEYMEQHPNPLDELQGVPNGQ